MDLFAMPPAPRRCSLKTTLPKKKVLAVFGTRPEAIKMAPVVLRLKEHSDRIGIRVCVTGQHRQMLDQVLDTFGITPDHDLNLMKPGQDLSALTGNILHELQPVLQSEKPDFVLVHGDTTTAFASSLAAFYGRVPLAHVEAGLRTGNINSPWPEEMNRKLVGVMAALHFAPTETARRNLLAESVPASQVLVTGNTVIDALFEVRRRIEQDSAMKRSLEERFRFLAPSYKTILVTGHRRESFGQGMRDLCAGLLEVLHANPDVQVCYPVHLNPQVQAPVNELLGKAPADVRGRIHLIAPVDYVPFVYLMTRAYVIVTDSGGIQEEAPSLGKPVLVTRDTTERPEAVEAGTARLVGTDREKIAAEISLLVKDPGEYTRRSGIQNPYGDGYAAERIAERLMNP